jgi:PBSX family phage terminase large subunit
VKDLSPKQQAAFLDSDARINILEGPVRSGKSFVSLLRWTDFCANGPPGPLILCGRTDKTIKRNIIDPLRDLIGDAVVYRQGRGEVFLFNRVMHVVGANDDRAEAKIRGSEFAGALADEATLLPENFFKMLLSRMSVEGAKVFCSTNADSPYHWLKRDFIDRKAELDLKVFSFNIRDNPSLTEKFIEDLSKEYQGLWYKRFIEGKWVLAEGAVYDFFNDANHVIPYSMSPADYYVCGIDYGTTNPTVFVLIGYNPNAYPNMWLEKEYYYDSKATMRQKSDYEYVKDYIEFIDGYNVKATYIDPSAASLRQEMLRNNVRRIFDANNEVIPGIRFQAQLLASGTYKICGGCHETIKEYSNYMWDSKASERGLDLPIKRFDHSMDAQRYALFTHFFLRKQSGGMTEKDAIEMEKMYTYR